MTGDYKPENRTPSLRGWSPDHGSPVKAVATAAELLSLAGPCEAIGFDWAGLACSYLDWKRLHSNAAPGSTLMFKGQEFQPELIPKACMILPSAIRDGSLQKFTDLLVSKEIQKVECVAPDPLDVKRILRLHAPGKIFTLQSEEKKVTHGNAKSTPVRPAAPSTPEV